LQSADRAGRVDENKNKNKRTQASEFGSCKGGNIGPWRGAGSCREPENPSNWSTLMHEDHWLSQSETRLQMLQASVAFLKANNPPD
jgi:hypothetical protein